MNEPRPRRRTVVLSLFAALLAACGGGGSDDPSAAERVEAAVAAIAATNMKGHIDTLAAEGLAGRICGSPGHDEARDYVKAQLEASGLEPFGDAGGFVMAYAAEPFRGHFQREADGSIVANHTDTCHNLVGILRGSDLAAEHIVLVAHYDHLGVTEAGEVYNGAFDDASGTAALIEVARAMTSAGVKPRRSIVFLVSDQEEQGLVGAGKWIESGKVPRAQIVAGIAVDPVGRGLLPDHAPIILSGAERSPELFAFLRGTRDLTSRPLGFIHRMMIPVYGSDHDQFFVHDLPGVWLVSPGMSFYHQTTDDADTIDYVVLRDVARYITRMTLRLADQSERFTYVGEPELDLVHAQDTKDVLVGVAGSTVITDSQRTQIQGYVQQLDGVLASDWSAIDSPLTFFVQALGFVAFQLPREHPGTIPPAFPTDE